MLYDDLILTEKYGNGIDFLGTLWNLQNVGLNVEEYVSATMKQLMSGNKEYDAHLLSPWLLTHNLTKININDISS